MSQANEQLTPSNIGPDFNLRPEELAGGSFVLDPDMARAMAHVEDRPRSEAAGVRMAALAIAEGYALNIRDADDSAKDKIQDSIPYKPARPGEVPEKRKPNDTEAFALKTITESSVALTRRGIEAAEQERLDGLRHTLIAKTRIAEQRGEEAAQRYNNFSSKAEEIKAAK